MKIKNIILALLLSSFLIACTGDAYTQLQLAASRGEIELIKEILDQGADVNETNKHHKTALMLAAGNGRLEATKLLLERNASINAQEIDGMTALMMAASDGKYETVKLLVDNGADINITNNYGATAITNAAFFNHPESVRAILSSKQKLKTDTSENALLISAGLGLDNIIKMFLDYGVDVNARGKNGRTPLMAAVEFNHLNTVKLLLENKANPKAKDTEGESIMDIAKDKGNKDIIALINNADK
jgi:ankyrin repeat protein